ncbi:NDP-sugar synthase [bacterium]|nr:NDP-sugar synthase [bacterium]
MINHTGKVKAMIMAAGVGSRLDPLTKELPKPLIPIFNVPVMDILMKKLADNNIQDVVANTYYLSDKIFSHYKNNQFNINLELIKEENLSGTAGGLKKCQFFFAPEDTIIVLSGDGISNVDIQKALNAHFKSNAIATIGIKEIEKNEVSKFGVVVTDEDGFIIEFQEKPAIQDAKSSCINTGIYVFNYKIFDYIPENTFFDFAKDVFPKLLMERQLATFKINEYWSDIGTLEQYKQTVKDIIDGTCEFEFAQKNDFKFLSDTKNVKRCINSTIGTDCNFGENVEIKNSILWDNVKVFADVRIENSVIGSNSVIKRDVINEIVGSNEILENNSVKLCT